MASLQCPNQGLRHCSSDSYRPYKAVPMFEAGRCGNANLVHSPSGNVVLHGPEISTKGERYPLWGLVSIVVTASNAVRQL